MRKSLITGGAGFIGSRLSRLLLEMGNDLSVLNVGNPVDYFRTVRR